MPGEKRVREVPEGGMTLRLIDADALDYALGASDEDIYFHHMLEDAPTIDAIPVEWLEEHEGENISDSNGNIYGLRRLTVTEAVLIWQKEQEAR